MSAPAKALAAVRTPGRSLSRQGRGVISIRFIVTSVALAITAAAMVGVGAVAERNARRALTAEVEARLFLEARNLARAATSALLEEFPELVLHPMVKEMQLERPELALVAVVDHRGDIQGHADARRLERRFEPPDGLEPVPGRHPLREQETISQNRDILAVRVPVTDAGGRSLGMAWVGLRRSHMDGLLADARRQVILLVGVALVLGMAATFAVMTWLLRPVDVLRKGLERIGRGDLDTPLVIRDRTELGMLAETVNTMAGELKNAQSAMVEKERLAHELDLAREIQRSLLPTGQIKKGAFLVDGTQEPAQEVGGDYYDFFELPDGKVGVAIADVSGKGLAGCLVMSMLSALLRAFKDERTSPSELLAELDARLAITVRPGTFVTMFYGILDPTTGVLTYASAAHCPTLVFRRATAAVEVQYSTGIPLGAVRDGRIRETLQDHTVRLEPGDMIVQYTDGVNETFDPSRREQFGMERLSELVKARAVEGWPALLDRLRLDLAAFRNEGPRDDDETLLVVARDPDAGVRTGFPEIAGEQGVGSGLLLPSRISALSGIRNWLPTCPGVERLDENEYEVLAVALYEACANIVEHGYAGAPDREIRLSLVPGEPGDPEEGAAHLEFVIRDQGRPFSADNWVGSDFADPAVRRRGRGFGLDIIHRAMVHVEYRPATPEGNVTLLAFDPAKHARERKLRYA